MHPRHVLGLKGALAVLGHVHIHADLLGSAERLDQYQLAGLPVWTLHNEEASGVPPHYTETQAVRPCASRGGGGRHAEERGGGLEVGRQGQVVKGHGLRSQVAGAAVHGAGVPLTLTAGHTHTHTQFFSVAKDKHQQVSALKYLHTCKHKLATAISNHGCLV